MRSHHQPVSPCCACSVIADAIAMPTFNVPGDPLGLIACLALLIH